MNLIINFYFPDAGSGIIPVQTDNNKILHLTPITQKTDINGVLANNYIRNITNNRKYLTGTFLCVCPCFFFVLMFFVFQIIIQSFSYIVRSREVTICTVKFSPHRSLNLYTQRQ